MEKRARHRRVRRYPDAQRKIFVSEVKTCIHCGGELQMRPNWHVRKTIQTLKRALCGRACEGLHECGVLPSRNTLLCEASLDVEFARQQLWAGCGRRYRRDEHEQRQLVEIQRELNQQGVEINERNVGKLYRQYLALLGASSATTGRSWMGWSRHTGV